MTSPEDSNLGQRWWTANRNIPTAVGIPPPSGGGGCQDDEITFDQLKALVGAEEAANLRVLKQQLDEDFIDEVADA